MRVLLERIEGALTVPASALIVSGEASHVWINDGGKAKRQPVETGYRSEDTVQILDGLSAGDEVIGTGYDSLRPGMPVEIDTSEDAMNLEGIAPDPNRSGMQHRWFSEEPLEDEASAEQPNQAPDQAPNKQEAK